MIYGFRDSLTFSIFFTTVTIMMATTFVQGNLSFGQAVDLIPIQTGNATLDTGLPVFYDCIDEKVDESKGVEVDPYFEKEPTKHEVNMCYNEVFIANSDAQSSNDNSDAQSSNDNSDAQSSNDNSDAQSSNDNSERSDIERFNSLFGFTG
ncbi:hypothetical protein [Candidatus Nitrosocosmicus arcticus]|uniref:Uncharacterized protein n=1 Tax=Candidatus Nitrosocosmicus arcticus TaxID=2035267 RepID=A0A557SX26_9ARCH|nr:hypothetical protein [Candidatus Nitrosocosmicus arcticus]TVP41157.1 hypothetical protein NARC_40120 [Candidatus Nitrosocosmicus arcticus]